MCTFAFQNVESCTYLKISVALTTHLVILFLLTFCLIYLFSESESGGWCFPLLWCFHQCVSLGLLAETVWASLGLHSMHKCWWWYFLIYCSLNHWVVFITVSNCLLYIECYSDWYMFGWPSFPHPPSFGLYDCFPSFHSEAVFTLQV